VMHHLEAFRRRFSDLIAVTDYVPKPHALRMTALLGCGPR
jgi:hypothetical protein